MFFNWLKLTILNYTFTRHLILLCDFLLLVLLISLLAFQFIASSCVVALCVATSSVAAAMVRTLALNTIECPIVIILVTTIDNARFFAWTTSRWFLLVRRLVQLFFLFLWSISNTPVTCIESEFFQELFLWMLHLHLHLVLHHVIPLEHTLQFVLLLTRRNAWLQQSISHADCSISLSVEWRLQSHWGLDIVRWSGHAFAAANYAIYISFCCLLEISG